MQHFPHFSVAHADDIPMICQTGNVHALKINVDVKNPWSSTGDYIVGQFISILNNLNTKVERVN